jgi:hypothetical protein
VTRQCETRIEAASARNGAGVVRKSAHHGVSFFPRPARGRVGAWGAERPSFAWRFFRCLRGGYFDNLICVLGVLFLEPNEIVHNNNCIDRILDRVNRKTDAHGKHYAVRICRQHYQRGEQAPRLTRPPAPEVFVPAFAAWPAALRRPAPPATLVHGPTLN